MLQARVRLCVLIAFVLPAAAACGPSGPNVAVMAMGPKFPPKPSNCEINYTVEDPTTVNMTHHIVAQIMVSGYDSGGQTLSNEITPELRKVLGPAACELGADTVSPGVSMAVAQSGGVSSAVTFYILKKRDQPLEPPPGMAPPAAAPPPQGPPPADTKSL